MVVDKNRSVISTPESNRGTVLAGGEAANDDIVIGTADGNNGSATAVGNDNGRDRVESIDDADTPLASGDQVGTSAAFEFPWLPIVLAIIVFGTLGLMLILAKRKRDKEEEELEAA